MNTTLTQSSNKVLAQFDKNEATRFTTPLADFIKATGYDKIALRFNKGTGLVSFKGWNEAKSVIMYAEYVADKLSSLETTEDTRVHIYQLGEFLSLAKVFNTGLTFSYDGNDFNLANENGELAVKFFPCDESVVNKCPESLKINEETAWHNTFVWDSAAYTQFIRGAQTLAHNFLIFDGKKGENKIVLSVSEKSKGMKVTTLKTVINVESENKDTFRVILDKPNFLSPITSSIGKYTVSVGTRFIRLVGESEGHKATYYITSVQDTE